MTFWWTDYRESLARLLDRPDAPTCPSCGCELDREPVPHSPRCQEVNSVSIFISLAAPDDEHQENCGIWIKRGDYWEMRSLAYCTCGRPDAPIKYQGSHFLPADTDERGGYVDLALIPSHITRDGRDDQPEDGAPWPFLRFGVNGETVILTRRNVEAVAASLNHWLERTAAPHSPRCKETQ